MESSVSQPDQPRYVVGVDYGTLSGRAVVVRVHDGLVVGTAVHPYTHGVMERSVGGTALPPAWALQNPADYRHVLGRAVPEALRDAGVDAADVVGVGIDFTACTMLGRLGRGSSSHSCDFIANAWLRSCMIDEPSP